MKKIIFSLAILAICAGRGFAESWEYYSGNTYTISTAATSTDLTISLLNPSGSNKKFYVTRVYAGFAGADFVAVYGTATVSGSHGFTVSGSSISYTPVSMTVGSGNSSVGTVRVSQTATLVGGNLMAQASTGTVTGGVCELVQGYAPIVLLPGDALIVDKLLAGSANNSYTIQWQEKR